MSTCILTPPHPKRLGILTMTQMLIEENIHLLQSWPPGINTVKTIFTIIELPYYYGKILMHCVGCSVSFQVDILVLATKD